MRQENKRPTAYYVNMPLLTEEIHNTSLYFAQKQRSSCDPHLVTDKCSQQQGPRNFPRSVAAVQHTSSSDIAFYNCAHWHPNYFGAS